MEKLFWLVKKSKSAKGQKTVQEIDALGLEETSGD